MRRPVGLFAVAAALASALPAGAALEPVNRTFGEVTLPRVRSGVIHVPRGQAQGRVRVIVGLQLPPLAAAYGRTLAGSGTTRRLNVRSAASRRYLARVAAAQRVAAAKLVRAIPQARIGRRFQVVLDGLTVTLPATKLAALTRLHFAKRIYPSIRYRLRTDTSPSLVGADELHALTGARGDGIKIGVVDDGVDPTNPYLRADGFDYPPGFPKGGRKWTTPKVIVARAFPGPRSGRPGRLAVDRSASFHGTHVAGIAAGDAGTTAPAGSDHPTTSGLSGVAPRAYLGNYRVFNVPTPLGNVANTPEIAAAFEFAVRDGMDVINFSGGGAESEPANDAMLDVIRNVAAAGVVPVIAAGNDRDDFGFGTIGSPGTAPQAITVAAVSNTHVFAPTLSVRVAGAPDNVRRIPIASAGGARFPDSYAIVPRTLVDVGTLAAAGGAPVDRRLCGPDSDTNNEALSPLPAGSLSGAVVLVSRGHCTFASKAIRAGLAGAAGMVLVDNRPGEANAVPIQLAIPAGMISDLDGARLRAYLATTGGRTAVTIGHDVERVETGRSGVVTSFSSAGLTEFSDLLKPDLAAPGGQILSSTLPEFTGDGPFAVFDGTSMATPHVTGAAALLVQLHPAWSPQEIKSALVSTAGPAWEDTARTREAPVTLAGGGLIDVARATDVQVFTDPASLSFRELNVNGGAQSKALLARIEDAGGGDGNWSVELKPQVGTSGATLAVPASVAVPPGGEAGLAAVAHASASATAGLNYGFIVLRRGTVTRRIPYVFEVARPQLEFLDAKPLERVQVGDTLSGPNRVTSYCCPAAPFGPAPDYFGPTMNETGSEKLYVTRVTKPLVNLGVSLVDSSGLIHPWFLGSKNEHDVQGYAGIPVNVNDYLLDFRFDIGAAAATFPRQQEFYVAVDSGSDIFSGRSEPGRYLLRSWQNDLRPPAIRLLTRRVSAGRPTLVARVTDAKSGVDPLTLVIAYRKVLVGAALYDPFSGIALFPLPPQAASLPAGKTVAVISASDYQESKNINTISNDVLPNTRFKAVTLSGITDRPALTWIAPREGQCLPTRAGLGVVASSTKKVVSVRFLVDRTKQVALVRKGTADVFAGSWNTRGAKPGKHLLSAVATDAGGRKASITRGIRICR